jgi:hypothetical protein
MVKARLKFELPASQAEIVTTPSASVGEAIAQLADGRRRLAQTAGISIERNGAIRQREVGLAAATRWLADRFLD